MHWQLRLPRIPRTPQDI